MGWWDAGIMGGDAPLDAMGEIADLLLGKGMYTGRNPQVISKNKLQRGQKKVCHLILRRMSEAEADGYGMDYAAILAQVAGWLYMTRGARISRHLHNLILWGIDEDEWGKEGSQKRLDRLNAFREKLNQYFPLCAAPVSLSEKGLLERINEVCP